jgi:hypothetical protein
MEWATGRALSWNKGKRMELVSGADAAVHIPAVRALEMEPKIVRMFLDRIEQDARSNGCY